MQPRVLAAVFAGGCVGTLARAGLAEAFASPGHGGGADWPWPTFAVNLLGAFLLGFLAERLVHERGHFLTTGVCGALTTFSTLQLELLHMLDSGHAALALAYAAASLAAGIAAVTLGRRAA
jgi:CrcB protein